MTRSEPKTADDRPYRVEYARSPGSSCRHCGRHIGQGSIRIAVMEEAKTHPDARVPSWFHFSCFFVQNKVGSINDIENWRDLRPEDQSYLEERIHGLHSEGLTDEEAEVEEARRKKSGTEVKFAAEKPHEAERHGMVHPAGMRIFKVEYARSGGSHCRACDANIGRGELRFGKRDVDTEHAMMYGPRVQHYHIKCFYQNRAGLDFHPEFSVEDVPGFDHLGSQDQARLTELFSGKGGRKGKETTSGRESGLGESRPVSREQPQLATAFKPHVAADFRGESITAGPATEEERQAEESGEIEAGDEGYQGEAQAPSLAKPMETRQRGEQPMEQETAEAIGHHGATAYQPPPLLDTGERPLANLRFVMAGRMQRRSLAEVRDDMERLGAIIVPDVDETVVAMIVSDYKARIGGHSKHVRAAMQSDVHVVGEDFVDDVINLAQSGRLVADPASYHEALKGGNGQVWLAELVARHALVANCGSDPAARIRRSLAAAQELPGGRHLGKSKAEEIELPEKGAEEKRMRVTPRLTVDPESGLEDEAHVLIKDDCVWSILLHSVPEASVTNFYYRIQLLESNDANAWWVYRSWGRLGTAIGSNKLDVFDSIEAAKLNFEMIFEEKTGLDWREGKFLPERVTGRYYPIDENEAEASHSPERMAID